MFDNALFFTITFNFSYAPYSTTTLSLLEANKQKQSLEKVLRLVFFFLPCFILHCRKSSKVCPCNNYNRKQYCQCLCRRVTIRTLVAVPVMTEVRANVRDANFSIFSSRSANKSERAKRQVKKSK